MSFKRQNNKQRTGPQRSLVREGAELREMLTQRPDFYSTDTSTTGITKLADEVLRIVNQLSVSVPSRETLHNLRLQLEKKHQVFKVVNEYESISQLGDLTEDITKRNHELAAQLPRIREERNELKRELQRLKERKRKVEFLNKSTLEMENASRVVFNFSRDEWIEALGDEAFFLELKDAGLFKINKSDDAELFGLGINIQNSSEASKKIQATLLDRIKKFEEELAAYKDQWMENVYKFQTIRQVLGYGDEDDSFDDYERYESSEDEDIDIDVDLDDGEEPEQLETQQENIEDAGKLTENADVSNAKTVEKSEPQPESPAKLEQEPLEDAMQVDSKEPGDDLEVEM